MGHHCTEEASPRSVQGTPTFLYYNRSTVSSALRIKRYELIHDPAAIERDRVLCLEEYTWRHDDHGGLVLAPDPFSPCGKDRFVIVWEDPSNGMPYLSITSRNAETGRLDGNEPLKHKLRVVAIDEKEVFEVWTDDSLTNGVIDTRTQSRRMVRYWTVEEPREDGVLFHETWKFIDLYQF